MGPGVLLGENPTCSVRYSDPGVRGHTTATMNYVSTPPPLPPSPDRHASPQRNITTVVATASGAWAVSNFVPAWRAGGRACPQARYCAAFLLPRCSVGGCSGPEYSRRLHRREVAETESKFAVNSAVAATSPTTILLSAGQGRRRVDICYNACARPAPATGNAQDGDRDRPHWTPFAPPPSSWRMLHNDYTPVWYSEEYVCGPLQRRRKQTLVSDPGPPSIRTISTAQHPSHAPGPPLLQSATARKYETRLVSLTVGHASLCASQLSNPFGVSSVFAGLPLKMFGDLVYACAYATPPAPPQSAGYLGAGTD